MDSLLFWLLFDIELFNFLPNFIQVKLVFWTPFLTVLLTFQVIGVQFFSLKQLDINSIIASLLAKRYYQTFQILTDKENLVICCYVTSMDSVFFRDCKISEYIFALLRKSKADTKYFHVITFTTRVPRR